MIPSEEYLESRIEADAETELTHVLNNSPEIETLISTAKLGGDISNLIVNKWCNPNDYSLEAQCRAMHAWRELCNMVHKEAKQETEKNVRERYE